MKRIIYARLALERFRPETRRWRFWWALHSATGTLKWMWEGGLV